MEQTNHNDLLSPTSCCKAMPIIKHKNKSFDQYNAETNLWKKIITMICSLRQVVTKQCLSQNTKTKASNKAKLKQTCGRN